MSYVCRVLVKGVVGVSTVIVVYLLSVRGDLKDLSPWDTKKPSLQPRLTAPTVPYRSHHRTWLSFTSYWRIIHLNLVSLVDFSHLGTQN